ncbi:Myo-inositol-1-phosphate synthase [Ectocarpus siliculosus]|uniref:inositol-3-phosphate synthase n=1 Tax=Ectocarpus siliculosus TaxID=2880 RepID=D7FUT9_ECTSI|nr:Myo-inositol-1-phosphate synthase [Ectocarpus siliculosus]|eukprot:CBJ31745.1 Myo-inositol-1-phosphate synthase [Ectocarpus siliculosus]
MVSPWPPLPSKGGSGGYRERYALADANNAAIGGWDIRPTPLGEALYNARILDFDLVRQVREEMDTLRLLPGVWDPDFIGESQHESATNVVGDGESQQSRLERLRIDIREFREAEGVTGHVTVIWSASVERPSEREFQEPSQLLEAIAADDKEVSPSILYAAAAVLEGCSFVNGGSQNTMCGALLKLAEDNACYMLGTDFKAGQTKFKTAAVEYIRSLGMCPKVIASSNHLGNNDMLNLTTKKTLGAKMRVKSNIFAPWEEDINHEVRVMYTPLMGDEKRDIVEYTSFGFMNCAHTMLTYTRAMDSALCVPLMIDAAVWCDYFARAGAHQGSVARALAYLFKVPEGGAQGVDPGFFKQMRALEEELEATRLGSVEAAAASPGGASAVGGMLVGRVLCAGISCLDLQLCGSGGGGEGGVETIRKFKETKYCPGGSCPQASTALARLGVPGVVAVTKMGADAHGDEMVRQMLAAGVDCSRVIRDASVQTALAVLPIFSSGERGCFVNLAANDDLLGDEVAAVLKEVAAEDGPPLAAFHYGYPHFTKQIQGQALADVLRLPRSLPGSPLVSLDLNGVDPGNDAPTRHAAVLEKAYPFVDILHANLEEAEAIVGPLETGDGDARLRALAEWFLSKGVAVVAITAGAKGSFTAVTSDAERLAASPGLARQVSAWAGREVRAAAFAAGEGAAVNANGAGDAFVGGLVLAAAAWRESLSLEEAVRFAALAALQRVDESLRQAEDATNAAELMTVARAGSLPPTLPLS